MRPTIKTESYAQGTAKKVRQAGRVPASVYGHNKDTHSVSVNKQEFKKVFRKAGKATLVDVDVNGEKIPSIIHVIDIHPISGDPLHIDFHMVNMKESVHATVPIKLVGVSDAVKLLGGIMTVQHQQVKIKCLPADLFSQIEADISVLKTFHDSITIADLKFPDNIEVLDNPENIIVSVSSPRLANEAEGENKEGVNKDEGKA